MFSPFRDEQGGPKGLAAVTYAGLAQLSDLDEGYVLEFKQELSASVRAKVPKIIASFANSRGGWLVIGISDDGSRVCPVPRLSADYSQIIGELCRRHISPAPPFDVRFIVDPADAEQGVIVVRVEEGTFPPYVADGVVEIREGSTSSPATGAMLVELYDKATRSAAHISEFCRRTVFYGVQVPLFDLYFYRIARAWPRFPVATPSTSEPIPWCAASLCKGSTAMCSTRTTRSSSVRRSLSMMRCRIPRSNSSPMNL